MSTRQKKLIINSPITTEAANEQFAQYSDADARIRKINATKDILINRIHEKYANELTEFIEQKDKAFDVLHAFGMQHKDQFESKRSMEFSHGILGFRTGTPKLKTLKGFTWAAVLAIIKVKLPDYVRTVDEINKEKILADRQILEIAQALPTVGISIDQDETFFVQPKQEEILI